MPQENGDLMMIWKFRSPVVLVLLAVLMVASCRSAGEFGSEPEQLIDKSRITFQSMMSDNQYPSLIDLASRAKAVLIVPSLLRAGFFFGGRGGNAIMLVRGEDGSWSPPAFYTIGGLSFGLQFGGESSELVVTIMTQRGLNAVINRQVTLGGDAGLAIGELGRGATAATGIGWNADMYAFARSAGLYAGVSLEGSVIAPRHTWNQQLYGVNATPSSILVDRTSSSASESVSSIIAAMP